MSEAVKDYGLRPLWGAILPIYTEFRGICERHGLRHWAAFGTALGAARHKGFIPWDDDFDVMMPREDYERFFQIAEAHERRTRLVEVRMKVLHVVPGLNEPNNGIAVAAKLIAAEQSKSGAEASLVETRDFIASSFASDLRSFDEIWVHSMWLPITLRACLKVVLSRRRLVRMTHANLDPLRYHYHGWKKRLFAPVERLLFKFTRRVVVTCEAEKKWCQMWGLKNEFEVLDMKKFFHLSVGEGLGRRSRSTAEDSLHVLYLGRRHPLKGVNYLEQAVEELNQSIEQSNNRTIDLRIVSDHFGEELERDWEWCDVLVLPTLSENFGLVVAEALEHGKRVITTDGAPVWEGQPGVTYLDGYVAAAQQVRVDMLARALSNVVEYKGTDCK